MPSQGLARLKAGVEFWFISLCLIAFTTTGIVPILLPQAIIKTEGQALHVGLVMSTIGAGMLTAPIWSGAADRYRWHRIMMVGSALAVGSSLLGFAYSSSLVHWLLCAFLMGCGVASAFTVANLLISCIYPPGKCDEKLGWLQTMTGLGTVLGLAAAGGVSSMPLSMGFLLGAVTSGTAALIAGIYTPSPPPGTTLRSIQMAMARSKTRPKPRLPFYILLVTWFVANVGMFGFAALYPLIMKAEFGVPSAEASFVLAAASAASTGLFLIASAATRRFGGGKVLAGAFLSRCLALCALSAVAAASFPGRGYVALALFFLVTIAWPLLSVSSTLLVSTLAPNKGDGLGVYSGAEAMGHLIGPILCGRLADSYGYGSIVSLALAGIALGLGLTLVLMYVTRHDDTSGAT